MNFATRTTSTGMLTLLASLFAAAATANAQNTQHYTQTNLVANRAGIAAVTDPNLVNPWGLSRSSSGPWWVSDNGTGLSTLYDGAGKITPLVVTVPRADTNSNTGTPTGTIFNGTHDFQIAPGKPAIFLFATEDGTISGWNPGVNATSAVIKVNTKDSSVFKGMTMGTVNDPLTGPANYLYVADFRKSAVLIFDKNFHRQHELEGRFADDDLPRGYSPFNVQNIGGNLYVTYAAQDSAKHDEIDGAGLGYVNVYSSSGRLLNRLEHGPWFNAPWGLTQASGDFGKYSHDILVGQFGSGEILAFNPITGRFEGRLRENSNAPIRIDGLWGLAFGNGAGAGPATSLYFAAGSNHEQDGLLGSIAAVENTQGNDQ